jgi:WD40 repeat protein
MTSYDRVLIQPARAELEQALGAAVTAANARGRVRLLRWPLEGCPAFLDEVEGRPEGWRQWNGGEGRGRTGESRAVVLAWWTDAVGRTHYRIAGRRGHFTRPSLNNLLCPSGKPRPPLWLVYPGYTFIRSSPGRRAFTAVCACGAFGSPEEIAWMGNCCGPCHDRREEGGARPRAWPDPGHTTLSCAGGSLDQVAFSPGGRTLLTGSWDYRSQRRTVTLWDARTGQEQSRLAEESPDPWFVCAAFHPDGMAVVTGHYRGTVSQRDIGTGKVRASFMARAPVEALALAPDGSRIGLGNHLGSSLWEAASGQLLHDWRLGLTDISALAFAPDGSTLAGGNREGTFKLWEVATGREQAAFSRPSGFVSALAFSPDGRTLAVGVESSFGPEAAGPSPPREVLLWDVHLGRLRATLPGHPGGTRCLAFAPDGRTLATGGYDHAVKLWDLVTGEERVALEWHLGSVSSVAFSPDGGTLATASYDGTAKLWPCELLRPA